MSCAAFKGQRTTAEGEKSYIDLSFKNNASKNVARFSLLHVISFFVNILRLSQLFIYRHATKIRQLDVVTINQVF